MVRRRSRQEWERLGREHERSGMSVRDFAEDPGLSHHTMSWWRWRIRSGRRGVQQPRSPEVPQHRRSRRGVRHRAVQGDLGGRARGEEGRLLPNPRAPRLRRDPWSGATCPRRARRPPTSARPCWTRAPSSGATNWTCCTTTARSPTSRSSSVGRSGDGPGRLRQARPPRGLDCLLHALREVQRAVPPPQPRGRPRGRQ